MGKKIFLILLLCAFGLQAHAPKAVELAYDAETAMLSVKVLHKVSNPEKHHIKRIAVYAGKELLAEKTYERQETAEGQDEMFLFIDKPLQKGDAVTVKAYCNIMGKKSADLKWE
jgi:desulfoferrodoxin (superoxide reductase-like protein)